MQHQSGQLRLIPERSPDKACHSQRVMAAECKRIQFCLTLDATTCISLGEARLARASPFISPQKRVELIHRKQTITTVCKFDSCFAAGEQVIHVL